MRAKTRFPKARLSKSPQKPPIVPNARCKLYAQDGSNNAETSMNRVEPGNDDDGDRGFGVDGTSFLGEECDLDGIDRVWLENDTCVECYKAGELFICGEVGCLMAYHEKCMNFKPDLEEKGKFYCPFCWFKRQTANSIRLKKKALLAKKALLDFMDPKFVGKVQENQNNVIFGEHVPSEVSFGKERNGADRSDRTEIGDGVHAEFAPSKEVHVPEMEIAKSNNYDQVEAMVEDQVEPVSLHEEGTNDGIHDQSMPVEEVNSYQNESAKPANFDQTEAMAEDLVDPGTLHKEDTDEGVNDQFVLVEEVHPHEKESAELTNCNQTEAVAEDQVEDEPLAITSHCGECDIVTAASHGLVKDEPDFVKEPQGNRGQREEEQMNQGVPEATMLSTGYDSAPMEEGLGKKVHKIPDSDAETVALHRKRVKQICRRKTSQPRDPKSPKGVFPESLTTMLNENNCNNDQKVDPSKEFRQPQESAKGFVNPQFSHEKRKRMFWTPEEEDMLRKGVQMYSTQVNKNIPWRKILDLGRQTFHSTRTPTDLRDKWRKILTKES
ncbi:hypothetical protein K2173_000034 [Erythroxylum novogranatense]|uniref:Myb-like domain-containing protein n=1 Tax=Erythroxylum novogranatense TaxID=1862640 RepID=A0AAV8SPE5_9ROSI|nr:hypothetical protein K2173_000034 [Erythroxylum novogranatense]